MAVEAPAPAAAVPRADKLTVGSGKDLLGSVGALLRWRWLLVPRRKRWTDEHLMKLSGMSAVVCEFLHNFWKLSAKVKVEMLMIFTNGWW